MMEKERMEEMLELLWTLRERGEELLSKAVKASQDDNPAEVIGALASEKLVATQDDRVALTPKGEEAAREIVRRHRLAEVLLAQVLELEDAEIADAACKFEHVLSPRVTESICTFLGHPPACPHGMPIPRGECCKKYKVEVAPVVTRLSEFEVGSKGKITFIVPTDPSRLGRLNSLGITAGSVIRLLQRNPSFVIQIDETTVAIDPEIAKEIYIKKAV